MISKPAFCRDQLGNHIHYGELCHSVNSMMSLSAPHQTSHMTGPDGCGLGEIASWDTLWPLLDLTELLDQKFYTPDFGQFYLNLLAVAFQEFRFQTVNNPNPIWKYHGLTSGAFFVHTSLVHTKQRFTVVCLLLKMLGSFIVTKKALHDHLSV